MGVRFNPFTGKLQWYPAAAAATTFIGLTDSPASYSGEGLNGVRVNVGETALEFYTPVVDTDEKVSVDSGAVAGYIGAASSDGVLRTASNLSYADGGDYVTLDVDSTKASNWDDAYSHISADGSSHTFINQNVTTTGTPTFNSATIGSVVIPTVYNDALDPTGFTNRSDSTISWDDGTYTLTITGTHYIYINGVKHTKETDSIQITDSTGLHWIYYNASGVLSEAIGDIPGFQFPLIATVYWNTTTNAGLVGDERHGIKMDFITHGYLHNSVGTRYVSGLTGTFDDTTFTVTLGVIYDEDIACNITEQTTCDVLYKDGSADYKWLAAQTKYYYEDGGSDINYNNGNTLTAVPSNNYVAYWIFATNDISVPIVSLMGQRIDTNIANARTNNRYESLTLGTLPFQEMKLLYRVILRNDATPYEEVQDLRSVSNLPAGTYVATDHGVLTGLADDDHTQYLLVDGTRALSANWDAGSFSITAETLVSDVTTGTAPFTVASTTVVTNLNADTLDAAHASSTPTANYIVVADASGFLHTPSAAPDADYEVANKKYVDDTVTGEDLDFSADAGANGSVDLDSQVFDIVGTANEIETTSDTNQQVQIGIVTNPTLGGTNITGMPTAGITGILTDNSMADTLHRHSELSASDGTPDQALTVDADGNVAIAGGNIEVVGDDNFFGEIAGNRATWISAAGTFGGIALTPDTNIGRMFIEGKTMGDLVISDAGSDDAMLIRQNGNTFSLASFVSSSGASNTTNIMSIDNDTGNIDLSGLLTITEVPAGTGVGQGSLYVNPASATADYTLFGVALNGSERFRIDEDGDVTVIGDMSIKAQKELRFYDNGNYVGFEAPALSADQIWVLPSADGAASTILQTDGSGNLSWADISSDIKYESQTATDGQTVFDISGFTYTTGSNELEVYVNGYRQTITDDYTETDSDTVTFVSGIVLDSKLIFYVPGRGTSFWSRSGTALSPATAGDDIIVEGDAVIEGMADTSALAISTITSVSSSSDAVDVTGKSILDVATAGGSVTIGGIASGGVTGQILIINKVSGGNNVIIEHNEASGTEKFLNSGSTDKTISAAFGSIMYLRRANGFWYQIGA